MSDDLIISGGGSTAVATDELFGDAAALRSVGNQAVELRHRVLSIERILNDYPNYGVALPGVVVDATRGLGNAIILLNAVGHRADQLAAMLMLAAHNYGEIEAAGERALRELSASGAYFAGLLSSIWFATVGPILPFAVAALIPSDSVVGKHRGGVDAGFWKTEGNQILTNPATVMMIREAAMSTDDYFGGTALLSPEVVHALGDEGLGVVGLNTSAALIAGMGSRAGLLTETPISIAATATSTPTAPPAGFAARISRLPDPLIDADHAQIVVEKYSAPGQVDRFQVYIGGTADFSPRAGGDAFDMTSNVSAMAGLPAGSYVAVERALADAGLRPADPVVFTGYSQGGLVASLLAASGDYNTHGIVTIGAPAGQVLLPHGIPAVVIEHTDDLVPALGGTQSNHDAVIVQRQAFGDRTVPNDIPVPAHHFEYYLETAQLLDNARSDQVTNAAQRLDAFGQDATSITSTRYFATRDPG